MAHPQRTCEEWVTVFQVAPNVKTIFVEGPTDVGLLSSQMRANDLDAGDIRSGDEVLVDGHLEGGNRARLALMAKCAEEYGVQNFCGLIDKDYGAFFSNISRFECLKITDFANIVSGSISEDWFRSFLSRAYNFRINADTWSDLCTALLRMFCLRYLAIVNKIAHNEFSLSKAAKWEDSRLVVDFQKLTRNFVRDRRDFDEVFIRSTELAQWIVGDCRDYIHSHDLTEYVYTFLRKSRKIGGAVPEMAVKEAIMASLPHDLGGQLTINELCVWFRAADAP